MTSELKHDDNYDGGFKYSIVKDCVGSSKPTVFQTLPELLIGLRAFVGQFTESDIVSIVRVGIISNTQIEQFEDIARQQGTHRITVLTGMGGGVERQVEVIHHKEKKQGSKKNTPIKGRPDDSHKSSRKNTPLKENPNEIDGSERQ
jgi:hypothetical protein